MIERLSPEAQKDSVRVPVDGIAAIAITATYKNLLRAQDDLVTILDFHCRQKGLRPDQILGWDDERGEFIVRP